MLNIQPSAFDQESPDANYIGLKMGATGLIGALMEE